MTVEQPQTRQEELERRRAVVYQRNRERRVNLALLIADIVVGGGHVSGQLRADYVVAVADDEAATVAHFDRTSG